MNSVELQFSELAHSVRLLQSAFPGFSLSEIPSGRLRCPRLQLRGSAGFAPASHSAGESPAYDHARTYFEKEQNSSPANLAANPIQSQPLVGEVAVQ
jgi:hypothetical protein